MFRLIALTVLTTTTLASAQVIFEPPPHPLPYDPYGPYPGGLTAHKRDLLRVLTPLRGTVIIINSPQSVEVQPAPQPSTDANIDPITGQPLFFRKRDLLPAPQPPAAQPAPEPAKPSQAPAPDNQAAPGQIIIKPCRPAAQSVAGR